jgi:hypothetical protein
MDKSFVVHNNGNVDILTTGMTQATEGRVMLSGRVSAQLRDRIRLAKAMKGMPIDAIISDALVNWLDAQLIPVSLQKEEK